MQQKGLFPQMLSDEKKETNVARGKNSKTRFQMFSDLFLPKFSQVLKINLWISLFFLPLCIALFLSNTYGTMQSLLYPFGANLGIGYPAVPEMQGVAEWLTFQQFVFTCVGVLLTSVVAAVGLAGGAYAVRNFIWTEGEFSVKIFFKGVKGNYKNMLYAAIFFSLSLLITVSAICAVEFNVAMGITGVELVLLRISQVLCYILLGVAVFMSLWMITLGVNYDLGLLKLIKNAFLMSVGTFPQTIFFGVISILPFAIFLWDGIGSLSFLAIAGLFSCFFVFALLVWLLYTHWVLDQYVEPKHAHSNKKEKNGKNDTKTERNTEKSKKDSRLLSKKIKPIDDGVVVEELPSSYSRKDLAKNKAQKNVLNKAAEVCEQNVNEESLEKNSKA